MRTAEEIRKVFKENGISGYRLNKDLGITQVGADKFLNGETKTPYKRTLEMYDEYIDNGFKVMENSNVKEPHEAYQVDFTELSVMYVPLVSKFAYAGYLGGFGDDEYVGDLPKIPFANGFRPKGKYLCFEVRGDSMTTDTRESIEEGDIVLAREVRKEYWKSKLHINQWDFVIVHRDEGILVKRIASHDVGNGILTLRSLNDYYEDFDVHLKDVAQIFNKDQDHSRPTDWRTARHGGP